MTASERIGNLMRGKSIDRLPVVEWAPWWNLTANRWNEEGLNIPYDFSQKSVRDIQLSFGLDACVQTLFSAFSADTPAPKEYGAGIIESKADYDRVKKTLYKDPSSIFPKEHFDWLKSTSAEGNTIHFLTVDGFFWYPRTLFGIEPHLYSFYDEPELLHEICADHTAWLKRVFEFVGNTFKFDFMTFEEDMSYNNGPMLSKDTFDEFLAPYYKQLMPLLKAMDLPSIIDSDGDITKAVDWYAEVGANGMLPLERQAGVDVSLYVQKQPQMTFIGHFDKMCMKFGEQAMRAEFERLLPSCKAGRVIPSVDHQTPPDVSIENYRTYVRLYKEYANKVQK